MKKYFCMALAFIAGVCAVLGLCWAIIAFISWETNIAAWPVAARFMVAFFGFTPAVMAGFYVASIVDAVVE